MAMYLGKQRVAILSQKYTTEKFSFRKTPNFGGLSQSTLFRVKKVKGATVKCKNLIPYPYHETTKTQNGITFTDNGDGSITVNGTATESASFYLKMRGSFPVGTYTISGNKDGIIINARKNGGTWLEESSWSNPTGQFNEGDVFDYISIYVTKGTVANNVRIYPMLNEGETALPYQPYFTGLKHAYINAIKSTGRNLIPYPFTETTKTVNGITFTPIEGGGLKVEGTSTNYASFTLSTLGDVQLEHGKLYSISPITNCCTATLTYYDGSGTQKYWGSGGKPLTWDTTYTLKSIYIQVSPNKTANETIYPMLNQGETEFPFEPYKEDIWQLPETLELKEWDELNPQSKEVKRRTGKIVFNNATNWVMLGSGEYARFSLSYEHLPQIPEGVEEAGAPWWTPPKIISSHFGEGDFNFDVFGLSTSNRIAKMFQQNLGSWDYFLSMNPITIEFEVEEQIEKIEGCPLTYTAFKGGTERVIQGEEDNSPFGAIPTIETGHTVIMELIGDENG